MGKTFTYKVHERTDPVSKAVLDHVLSFVKYDMDRFNEFVNCCSLSSGAIDASLAYFLECRKAHGCEFFFIPLANNTIAMPMLNRFLLPMYCTIDMERPGIVYAHRKQQASKHKVDFVIGYFPFIGYRKIMRQGEIESTEYEKGRSSRSASGMSSSAMRTSPTSR
eukprot:549722-Hanusia_phi.AAC.7